MTGTPQEIRFSFDEKSRSFTIQTAGAPDVGVLSFVPALEVNGATWEAAQADKVRCEGVIGKGRSASIAFAFPGIGVEWRVQCELSSNGCTATVSSEIVNRSDAELRLGKCWLLRVLAGCGKVLLGPDKGDAVFLDYTASQARTMVRKVRDGDGRHLTKVLSQIYNPSGPAALHCGFVTFDRVNTEHVFAYGPAGVQEFGSYCDFDGFVLKPGGSIRCETLMVEINRNPYHSLESWADRVQGHYRPGIWPKNPVGWVGWSWVDGFNVERHGDVVLRNAKAIKRRLDGLGVEYIWVSIGNLKDGIPGNWLEFNTEYFPEGVEVLVSRLRDLGLKLGFWVAPFWLCSYLKDKGEALKDALLRKPDGSLLVTRSEWQYGVAGKMPKGQRPVCYALDGSHPKTIALLKKVFSTYREWGVRYYMIDFLEAGAGSMRGVHRYADYHDHRLVRGTEVYRNALKAVREAAGEDTYLLASSGPTTHNVGLVDAVRTGNDYGEGRALYPESYFYPATFVINSAAYWTSHAWASGNMAGTYFTHRKLYINDSGNVMTVDKPVPMQDAQITATIFGIGGGPMMIGDDLDRMSEERLALVKKCLPRPDEVAFPVDLFDSPAPDYPKVFHLKITKPWDEWHIVAVFNYDDEPRKEPVRFSKLGLDAGATYVVWEFWNEQYLGAKKDSFTAMLPPRCARLYRVCRQRPHPWLLSTDIHARQGQVEILKCSWDERTYTLSGEAARPKGEVGNIFVVVPAGLRLAEPAGHWIAKDAREGVLIVRRELKFDGAPQLWAMRFAPIAGGELVGRQD